MASRSRLPKDEPNKEGGSSIPTTPWAVLQAAITAVPAVRYALGIAGIGAVVSIIAGFLTDPRIAVFGVIIVIALMFILLIFSRLTEAPSNHLIPAALVLTWGFSTIILGVTLLLVMGYFFEWPRPLTTILESTASVPKPTVTIEGPSTAPLGKTTFYTVISQNAVRGEWSIGGFQNNEIIPVRPLAPSHQIKVEPTDTTRVGHSFAIVFTAYNQAGEAVTGEKSFVIAPAEQPCENTMVRCAKELKLDETQPGSVAQSEQRWYKFHTTGQRGGRVHVLVRNLDLDPQIILTATLLNAQEAELKSNPWGLGTNAILDFQSLVSDTYYVRVTAKMFVTSRVLLRFEIQISES